MRRREGKVRKGGRGRRKGGRDNEDRMDSCCVAEGGREGGGEVGYHEYVSLALPGLGTCFYGTLGALLGRSWGTASSSMV